MKSENTAQKGTRKSRKKTKIGSIKEKDLLNRKNNNISDVIMDLGLDFGIAAQKCTKVGTTEKKNGCT